MCCTSRRLRLVDVFIFHLPDDPVFTSPSVLNRGAFFLSSAVTDRQRQSSSMVVLLPTAPNHIILTGTKDSSRNSAREQLHHISSCLLQQHPDGCSFVANGRRRVILNVAARLIDDGGRFDRVSDLIRDRLHWLRVPQRISFKCDLFAHKVQNGSAPNYINS